MGSSDTPPPSPIAAAIRRSGPISRHFPFFLAVAEELNFHRASERLNVAQSALSRRIADLETELGGTLLFQRTPRGLLLTAAGAALAKDVGAIVTDIERAIHHTIRVGRGEEGTLAVAFSDAVLRRPFLSTVLRRYREQQPGVELRPCPLRSEVQREQLRGGGIDVGFVIEEAGDRDEFKVLRVGLDRALLAIPADHPLADADPVEVEAIRAERFILPSRQVSPRLFGRMVSALDRAGLTPTIVSEANSTEALFALVDAGLGLGIVSAAQGAAVPPSIRLRVLQGLELTTPISMIWSSRPLSPAAAIFVETVRNVLSEGGIRETASEA